MNIPDILHPPLPEGKEHLVYRDLPKMRRGLFDWFLEKLEPFELEVLTYAVYHGEKETFARGQILVRPDGLEKLLDFFEQDEERLKSEGLIA